MEGVTCSLCQAATNLSCKSCSVPLCAIHLKPHRPADTCLPFTVKVADGVGRYVIATRDIAASEIILEDIPAIIGPNFDTEAICVECMGRPDGTFLCHQCDMPLCSEECRDGPRHKPECQMFSAMEPKVQIKQYKKKPTNNNATGQICYEYSCISVLRMLSLRDSDPDSWARVQLLMDHDEERKKEVDYWQMFQTNVVDYIRIKGGLADKYSQEEINRCIGILRTNAFMSQQPHMLAAGTDGKAIYPTFSFLSHSCKANARYIVMEDDRLVLRAQVDIKAGEEITIQYISFLFGNTRRRREIHQCWMFECRCERCLDPREFGVLLAAHLCQECGGTVLPENNILYCPVWRCDKCDGTTSSEAIDTIEGEIETDMFNTFDTETAKYRALMEKWSPKIHPNHFQMLMLKKYLAISMRGNMTFAEMEEKIALQEEFISKYEIVDPGVTKWKGKLLHVICKLKLFLIDQKMARGKITQEVFLKELNSCIVGLDEVMKCLEHEPNGTVEMKIWQEAKVYHTQAKDILHMAKMVG